MPATEQTWRDQKLLHRVFAVSGLLMLMATIWMFVVDHDRPWKPFQRTARNVEIKTTRWRELEYQSADQLALNNKLQAELDAARLLAIPAGALDAFKAEVHANELTATYDFADLDAHVTQLASLANTPAAESVRADVLNELRAILNGARFQENTLLGKRKFAAANRDKEVAELGLLVRDGKSAEEQAEKQVEVDEVKQKFNDLTVAYDAASDHRKKLRDQLREITRQEDEAASKLNASQFALKALETTNRDLRSTYLTWYGPLPLPGKKWLELPILDAFNSPLKIENRWSDGLTINYNFSDVRRFDRCTTCHQLMEKSLPGQATKAAYQNEYLVELVVSPPAADALATIENELGDDPSPEARLQAIFGLRLASEGLVSEADVTVQYVVPESPAAQAVAVVDESRHAEQTGEEIRRELLAGTLDPKHGAPGINMGDVIHLFDGDPVTDAGKTLFRLLDAADAGQPATLTLRRGLPNPYTTHPRLDLYIGSLSPHKVADFACTICHDGQGSATDFKWASHTPNTERERQDWARDYGWFDNHHWIYPMSPKRFIESTCLKCHHDVTELEPSERFPEAPAPQLIKGYHLLSKYGCYGCHEINGYDGEKRIGPDMRIEPNVFAAALQLKTDPAYESLSDIAKDWAEQLAQHPEREAVRERLYEVLNADKDATSPKFSPDTHAHLTPLLKKAESPGTMRKSGPALRYVKHKVDGPFLFDWIREPKHFRPDTRMPQFFGLWNHIQGTPGETLAAKYEPIEILGIATYLLERSQDFAYAEPVAGAVPAVADRGRTAFQVRGCLACHNHDQFKDTAAFRPPGEIVQGPDLSGIGDKLKHENGRRWLYSWVKEPNRYHARTVMPNLFLDAYQDADGNTIDPAADIVAFLGESTVHWEPKPDTLAGPADLAKDFNGDGLTGLDDLNDLVREYLRELFSEKAAEEYRQKGIPEAYRDELKGAETELVVGDQERSSESFELPTKAKLIYVGRMTIAKYGCYGCHDIPGFEDAKPIATGLADWGRKEPSRLAFEHIVNYLEGHGPRDAHGSANEHDSAVSDGANHQDPGHAGAHDNGEDPTAAEGAAHAHPTPLVDTAPEQMREFFMHQLHVQNRTGFIYQKLLEPRSFDYHKTENKKYNERLRMPAFPFDGEDRQAIITFVLGLVAEPPAEKYIYKPDQRAAALIAGKQAIEKYNCGGCHLLETNTWNVAYRNAFDPQPDSPDKPIPVFGSHVSSAELAATATADPRTGLYHAELHGMPAIDPGNRSALVPIAYDDEGEPLENDAKYDPTRLELGFQLWQNSLLNGNVYQPGIQTALNLPTSWVQQTSAGEGGFLAQYLLPHVFQLEKLDNPNANPGEAWAWVPPPLIQEGKKVQTEWLHDFLLNPYPIRPAVFLRMPKFNMSPAEATAIANYFAAKDNAEYPYAFDSRRQTDHLAKEEANYEALVGAGSGRTRLDDAMKIVTNGDGCAKCHIVDDYAPKGSDRAKAPNLAKVYERLRPDYVKRWIAYPKGILPYTAMPVNLPYDPDSPTLGGVKQDPAKLEVFHGSSFEQLDGLVDLLMNFDAYAKSRSLVTPLVTGEAAPAAATPAAPATPATAVTPAPAATPAPMPTPAVPAPAVSVLPAILKDLPKATGWGDLKVRFRFDGTPPTAAAIVANKDPEYCGKFDLHDESLVVNPAGGGIKNVIAYLYLGRDAGKIPLHDSYIAQAQKTVSVDNVKCRFEPHVSLLWTPQSMEVSNSDSVGHNTNFTAIENAGINILIPANSKTNVAFPKEERIPISVACNIHPWMKGFVLIRDNPYFAVSDDNGDLSIKNLPEGEWTIQFWHEKSGYVRTGKRDGAPVDWKSGRASVVIENGKTADLGTMDLAAELFKD